MCFKNTLFVGMCRFLPNINGLERVEKTGFLAVQRSGSLPLVLHHKLVDLALKDKIPIVKNSDACLLKPKLYLSKLGLAVLSSHSISTTVL
jgi:hypothetical protein